MKISVIISSFALSLLFITQTSLMCGDLPAYQCAYDSHHFSLDIGPNNLGMSPTLHLVPYSNTPSNDERSWAEIFQQEPKSTSYFLELRREGNQILIHLGGSRSTDNSSIHSSPKKIFHIANPLEHCTIYYPPMPPAPNTHTSLPLPHQVIPPRPPYVSHAIGASPFPFAPGQGIPQFRQPMQPSILKAPQSFPPRPASYVNPMFHYAPPLPQQNCSGIPKTSLPMTKHYHPPVQPPFFSQNNASDNALNQMAAQIQNLTSEVHHLRKAVAILTILPVDEENNKDANNSRDTTPALPNSPIERTAPENNTDQSAIMSTACFIDGGKNSGSHEEKSNNLSNQIGKNIKTPEERAVRNAAKKMREQEEKQAKLAAQAAQQAQEEELKRAKRAEQEKKAAEKRREIEEAKSQKKQPTQQAITSKSIVENNSNKQNSSQTVAPEKNTEQDADGKKKEQREQQQRRAQEKQIKEEERKARDRKHLRAQYAEYVKQGTFNGIRGSILLTEEEITAYKIDAAIEHIKKHRKMNAISTRETDAAKAYLKEICTTRQKAKTENVIRACQTLLLFKEEHSLLDFCYQTSLYLKDPETTVMALHTLSQNINQHNYTIAYFQSYVKKLCELELIYPENTYESVPLYFHIWYLIVITLRDERHKKEELPKVIKTLKRGLELHPGNQLLSDALQDIHQRIADLTPSTSSASQETTTGLIRSEIDAQCASSYEKYLIFRQQNPLHYNVGLIYSTYDCLKKASPEFFKASGKDITSEYIKARYIHILSLQQKNSKQETENPLTDTMQSEFLQLLKTYGLEHCQEPCHVKSIPDEKLQELKKNPGMCQKKEPYLIYFRQEQELMLRRDLFQHTRTREKFISDALECFPTDPVLLHLRLWTANDNDKRAKIAYGLYLKTEGSRPEFLLRAKELIEKGNPFCFFHQDLKARIDQDSPGLTAP